MNSNKQLKIGIIMSYLSIGISVLTGIFYTPWMISSIGRENYGLFTLANSVIMFFMFDFGLSSAVTRFISKYLAEDKQEKANNFMGIVLNLYIACDIIFIIVLTSIFFFIPTIYKELTPDEIDKFKVIYAIAGVYSIISFPFIPLNGILIANEKIVHVKLCDVFHKIFIVITMTICLSLNYGLYALVLVNALSGIFTIFLKLWCITKYTDTRVNIRYYERNEYRNVLDFSVWTMLVSLAQRFIITLAPSILGMFSGSTSIAILGIAISIEAYTYTFSNAIGGVFLPKVSKIVSSDKSSVLPLMIRVGRFQILIVGFMILAVICLGDNFIHLWVGDDFKDSYWCAVLMVLPSLFFTPQEIAKQAVLAQNKVRSQAIIYIYCSIISVLLAVTLSPVLGPLGIAISICSTYFLRGIWQNITLYNKILGIDVVKFIKESFIPMSIPLVITLSIGLAVNYIIDSQSYMAFVTKAVVLTIVYFVTMYFALNDYEKSTLIKPILTKLNRSTD